MVTAVSGRVPGFEHGLDLLPVLQRRFKDCSYRRFEGGKDKFAFAIPRALRNFFWWLQLSQKAFCTLGGLLSYGIWNLCYKRGHRILGELSGKHLGYGRMWSVRLCQTTGLHRLWCIHDLFWHHKSWVVWQLNRSLAARDSIFSAEHTSAFGWNEMRPAKYFEQQVGYCVRAPFPVFLMYLQ